MIQHYEITWPNLPRGTLLCDATPGCAAFWAGPMLSILEELCQIPAEIRPEAVLLGSDHAIPLESLVARAREHGEFTPGLNRGAVVGPWLAKLAQPRPTVLISMSGTAILDLQDWQTPGWLQQFAVYRFFGEDRISPAAFQEWGEDTPLETIRAFLTDAVVELTLYGPGGAFIDWTNAEAELGNTPETLIVRQPLGAVRVGFYHPEGHPPRAKLVRVSGDQVEAVVRPCEAPPPPAEVLLLSSDTMLTLWSRGLGYSCKACGYTHPCGQARCPHGTATLLDVLERDHFYILKRQRDHWTAAMAPRGCVPLEDGTIALILSSSCVRIDADKVSHVLTTFFQKTHDGGYLVRT